MKLNIIETEERRLIRKRRAIKVIAELVVFAIIIGSIIASIIYFFSNGLDKINKKDKVINSINK